MLALDACAHSGEFISANAREHAVLTCRLNPGPEWCATMPVNEKQLSSQSNRPCGDKKCVR